MRKNPYISDQLIDRAVELWCRALHNPSYDNGDGSGVGVMAEGLAASNAAHARDKMEDYAEAVSKFGRLLSTRLKFLRDNEGKPRPADEIERDKARGATYAAETYWLETILSSDYGPGRLLSEMADLAGIPHSAFSYKSTVRFDHTSVSASFGYGAEHRQHYPMPDGGWLITTLSGSDIDKVIEAVAEGRITDLMVESRQ